MAAYIVATVRVTDAEKFAAYGKGIAGLSEQFGGESIAKGPVAEWLEGEGPAGERVVVSRYPDADAARAYIASAQYQAAAALRAGAGEVVMRLLVDPA
ncbi:DUF1330 domain-containing protein [Sphingobium sp. TCM1]|uniref:DUF1330 domain-containing protein n=1 Tax=Sphingobium sp. TCM1 TaxID=453246 RepID=UPI0007F3CCA2|nr:DUF1330 domain-containing protein [Sphingobium sp. TCM1]OAN56560.1 hypothetical protein A7Q26_18425 [Sphingobium sp. TCM1]